MTTLPSYVLITPARNEAQFIELTLKSVIAQTVRPLKWVIVSDGSTDGMDDIVRRYAVDHPWIELLRMPERQERHFAGKVYAFNAGYASVAKLPFDVIANLDADTSFESDYFSFLLQKLGDDSSLGLVGGKLVDTSTQQAYNYDNIGIDYVSGPCQVFRRKCFEDIGGYQPMTSGGVDLVAVLSTRTKGWGSRVFPEKVCLHHRRMNAAQMTGFRERLHRGRMDYLLGSHPLWAFLRGIYQMKNKPYLIGGVLILVAYFGASLRGVTRTLPEELVSFRRKEQMRRLKQIFRRMLPGGGETGSGRETNTTAGQHL